MAKMKGTVIFMPHILTCHNCGADVELPDDRSAGFCLNCGTKVSLSDSESRDRAVHSDTPTAREETPVFIPSSEAPTELLSGAETIPPFEAPDAVPIPSESEPYYGDGPEVALAESPAYLETPPAKRSRLPKLLIAVCAALAVIAVAAFAVPALAGNSYQKTEARFLSSLLSAAPVGAEKGRRVDFSLQYEPGPGEEFGHINTLLLSGSISAAGSDALADFSLLSGGKKVSDFIFASGDSGIALSAPDLTRYFLLLPSAYAADYGVDFGSLDGEALSKTLSDILLEYFRLTKDAVETEKGMTLSVNGVDVKCDKYTIAFTEQMTAELMLSAINEIRANPNLMEFIQNIVEQQYYYGYGDFNIDEALREVESELRETDGAAVLFRMTVWAANGVIAARKIDDIAGSDVTIYYESRSTDARRHAAFEMRGDGAELSFAFDAEKIGGVWNGVSELTVTDTYFNETELRVRADYQGVARSEKSVSGRVDVACELGDGSTITLGAALGGEGDRQRVKIDGAINDGYFTYELGALTLTYAASDIDTVKMPPLDENYAVRADDYSDENFRRAETMTDELLLLAEDYEDSGDLFISGLLWALANYSDIISGGYYDYDYGYDYDGFDYDFDYDYNFELDPDFSGFGEYYDFGSAAAGVYEYEETFFTSIER
jgi:hypothetical protein